MTDTKTLFPHYWICSACAKERGGQWPKGHVATLAEMTCKYCNGKNQIEKIIAPWVDYDWEEKAVNRVAESGRD